MSWLTSLFSYYLCTEYQLCYKNRATTQCRQRQGNVKIKSQCLDCDILSHIIVICNIVRPKNQFNGVLLCFLKKVSVENSNWENKRSFWMTCQTKSDKLNICETTHFFQRPQSQKCTMGKLRHWTCWTFFSHYCSKYWLMTQQQHRVVTKGSRCTALVTATLLWL